MSCAQWLVGNSNIDEWSHQKYAGNFEIVGVSEDMQYRAPDEHIRPMFFLPGAQWAKYEDKSEVICSSPSTTLLAVGAN
jgi:hypothetical protein